MIWLLLFFNGMPAIGSALVPVPHIALQLLPAAALGLAALLAIQLNRHMLIRPNVVLGLGTLLLAVAFTTSVRGTAGLGAMLRCARFSGFLATLWLLTPWWGRHDMLLLRCHLRALLIVMATIVAGLLVAPSRALGGTQQGRLVGIVWHIPAPQVGQYAAVAAGCAIVGWLSGAIERKYAFPLVVVGVAFIGLSQTRTALLAVCIGIVLAALSLVLARPRVRRVFATVVLVAPLVLFVAAPALALWFHRGQSSSEISALTGRRAVWASVLSQPRSAFNRWLGFGLSDKSANGHPIDDTWLAVYKDEGIVGDVIVGAIFLFVLIAPSFHPPGPQRALALFLVGYCAVASYTEVTLGDATPYLLHIVAAASLIVPAVAGRAIPADAGVPVPR
ncbi:MAG: O-antigen ligase domain-containing protein [Actinomycetota bacterium]|nr:O-antigen ligase domain-containing protein [Actinomycetota bacterium]